MGERRRGHRRPTRPILGHSSPPGCLARASFSVALPTHSYTPGPLETSWTLWQRLSFGCHLAAPKPLPTRACLLEGQPLPSREQAVLGSSPFPAYSLPSLCQAPPPFHAPRKRAINSSVSSNHPCLCFQCQGNLLVGSPSKRGEHFSCV